MKKYLLFIFTASITLSQSSIQMNLLTDYGKNELDFQEKYNENRLLLQYFSNNWEVGVGLSYFDPPRSYVSLPEKEFFDRKYIQYTDDNFSIRLGSFYKVFGRGLILNSYENKTLGINNVIEGVHTMYEFDWFTVDAIWGELYPSYREETNQIGGAQIIASPIEDLQLGVSYVNTHTNIAGSLELKSFSADYNHGYFNIYSEYAISNKNVFENKNILKPSDFEENSFAHYSSLNAYYSETSLFVEYKNYQNFFIYDNHNTDADFIIYNKPPALIQDHKFTLPSRHGYTFGTDFSVEKAISIKLDQGITEDINSSVFFNETWNGNGENIFIERFFQTDASFDNEIDATFLIGNQRHYDPFFFRTLTYDHAGINITKGFSGFSLAVTHEIQTLSDNTTSDEGSANFTTFEIVKNNLLGISFLYETYSGKYKIPGPPKDTDEWFGVKLDSKYWESLQVSIFKGKRKGGKLCVGGVCQELPEFDGVELNLTYFFNHDL